GAGGTLLAGGRASVVPDPVPWHRHRRAVVPSHGLVAGDERRRTSRGRHSAPRAPQESGATILGTRRRPGQTDTRARGSTDHRPPTRHTPLTIGYQSPAVLRWFNSIVKHCIIRNYDISHKDTNSAQERISFICCPEFRMSRPIRNEFSSLESYPVAHISPRLPRWHQFVST